jgi:RHS repeat-associated protein
MEIGEPSSNIEFQYTDKELDEDTGLYNFHARYRDPVDNRFYGRDRVKLEDNLKNYFGINPYLFTNNNPIKFIDPDGRDNIVFTKSMNPTYQRMESIVLYYPSTTLISESFIHGRSAESIMGIYGKPDAVIRDFSTLSDDPTRYGTITEGKHHYEHGDMGWENNLYSKKALRLGDSGTVRQDFSYGLGINPASLNENITGAYFHIANGTFWNDLKTTGSKGCLTGLGEATDALFYQIDNSVTGMSGDLFINRTVYGLDQISGF